MLPFGAGRDLGSECRVRRIGANAYKCQVRAVPCVYYEVIPRGIVFIMSVRVFIRYYFFLFI